MALRSNLSRQLRLIRPIVHSGRCGLTPIGMPSEPLIDGLCTLPQVQDQSACWNSTDDHHAQRWCSTATGTACLRRPLHRELQCSSALRSFAGDTRRGNAAAAGRRSSLTALPDSILRSQFVQHCGGHRRAVQRSLRTIRGTCIGAVRVAAAGLQHSVAVFGLSASRGALSDGSSAAGSGPHSAAGVALDHGPAGALLRGPRAQGPGQGVPSPSSCLRFGL